MTGASYCLCTGLDESVGQTVWGDAAAAAADWIRKGLASTFHEDTKGGDKTYLLIGRLFSDTQEHRDLLEVIYRILSLDFIGRYRYDSDGTRKHDAVRQRLYTKITAGREIQRRYRCHRTGNRTRGASACRCTIFRFGSPSQCSL